MPHVTFIHGIANKPELETLHRIWLDSLRRGTDEHDGLDLLGEGVTTSMVYWADVMYESPAEAMAAHEASTEAVGAKEDPDPEMGWREAASGEERAWIDSFADTLGYEQPPPGGDEDAETALTDAQVAAGVAFERIPLPWWLKRRIMKALLRDVHHYLFNVEFAARAADPAVLVQDEIRGRMLRALREGADQDGPHVVVSHSMGTVIAYDCLKRADGCPPVDGLITIGSPLGLDEVQDKLQPGWSRPDGFPHERLGDGAWVNVYDRLDPVAGFDPKLRNDYQRGGEGTVEDIHEPNFGKWRHNISKYLGGTRLRRRLAEMLDLD